jgi:hypothetical protein
MLARNLKMSIIAFAIAMASALATPAISETLAVDGQVTIKPTGVETPQRGSSMAAVEAKFGAPANKSGPVGTPPITKWFYPTFVVVFEHDKVLHAVVVGG